MIVPAAGLRLPSIRNQPSRSFCSSCGSNWSERNGTSGVQEQARSIWARNVDILRKHERERKSTLLYTLYSKASTHSLHRAVQSPCPPPLTPEIPPIHMKLLAIFTAPFSIPAEFPIHPSSSTLLVVRLLTNSPSPLSPYHAS